MLPYCTDYIDECSNISVILISFAIIEIISSINTLQ